MGENLAVGIAFFSHHGGADLTQAHSVAPAGSVERE